MSHRPLGTRTACVALGLSVTAVLGCEAPPPPPIDPAVHRADVDSWRQYRYDLLDEEGWLLLTGLHWLESGDNTFGSDRTNALVFGGADIPGQIGVFTVRDSTVSMRVRSGVTVAHDGRAVDELTMEPGSQTNGTLVTLGSLNWHVIQRRGQFAVRVRDSLAPSLVEFDSIPSFPLNAEWRLAARFDRYDPPKSIQVPSILGTVNEQPSPGAVVFKVGRKTYRLDAVGDPADDKFWIQFGDETNGFDTYGGGRYIWVDAPTDGDRIVVDFNKSYNPPCVFTPYATCPLPPRQNKLPLRIEAGELAYKTP